MYMTRGNQKVQEAVISRPLDDGSAVVIFVSGSSPEHVEESNPTDYDRWNLRKYVANIRGSGFTIAYFTNEGSGGRRTACFDSTNTRDGLQGTSIQ
jgi:hypothetical protein